LKPNHAVSERTGVRLPGFRLVLVRPKFAGNLGACARLAANFGLTDICVVAPECATDWRNSEQVQAFATGSSTENLADFRELPTLGAALADCTHALAFTRRPRELHPLDRIFSDALLKPGQSPSHPGHCAWPGEHERIALVFGNEKTGLIDTEIAACSQAVRISTSDIVGSMNLSHAVGVVLARLYERAELHAEVAPSTQVTTDSDKEETDRPATLEELSALWNHWNQALITLGFTQAGNPERMLRRIQTLLSPLAWRRPDVQLFRGILTRIQKQS